MGKAARKIWLAGMALTCGVSLGTVANTLSGTGVAYASTISVNTLQTAVNRLMNQYVKYGYFSGTVLLARHGTVLMENGYGYANSSQKTSNTTQTRYAIGPLTETFTAAAILQLQDKGLLSLDDSMYKYYPNLPQTANITLRLLLTHTSGIPADVKQPITHPGLAFEYSPINYIILGDIIAKVSGESYNSYIQNHILTPLGLNNTGFITSMSSVPKSATGYIKDTKKQVQSVNYQTVPIIMSSDGMYSTVDDLLKWDQALHSGKVASYNAMQQMFTGDPITVSSLKSAGFGFGWMTSIDNKLAKAEGAVGGYHARIDRDIPDDATVIILSNEAWAPEAEISGYLASLLMHTQLPATNAPSSVGGQKQISINGTTLSRPFGRISSDTMHMPIWYIGQALERLGVKQSWNATNRVWNITLPSNVKSDFSNIDVGTGNTDIVINGQLVKRINTYAWADPAGGNDPTVYAPIFYIQQILQAAGIANTWDGNTWSATGTLAQH